jgi:hypothetical protein
MRKVLLVLVSIAVLAAVAWLWVRVVKQRTIMLTGAVITRDPDPRKQLPISGVEITASDGRAVVRTTSDASGLFAVQVRRRFLRTPGLALRFRHKDYQPLDLNLQPSSNIYVAAMIPLLPESAISESQAKGTISNLVVRYSIKAAAVANIGSAARPFQVVNKGNVPCRKRPPCSPDGKWKAGVGSAQLDAGPGNEFRNARASCIAGPCPFTRIFLADLERDGRTVAVTATAWSDTATFLLEAEVVHPMVSDAVRNSYPVVFGDALNFTLPPAAEGVTIQADLNGETVVFPLGPLLILSWADCNARANPDQTRVYRCELKPGYRWLNPRT